MGTRPLSIPIRIALILMLASLSGLASPAAAAPGVRCIGDPFAFAAVQTTGFIRDARRASVEWEASGGTTTLSCPGAVLTIDVWEHAFARARGQGGRIRLAGGIEVAVTVPDGGTILIGGVIQGGGTCEAGVCEIEARVRASHTDGTTLRLTQRMTIDFMTEEVLGIEVLGIVIEFTSAG